jgi:hypothetical protein
MIRQWSTQIARMFADYGMPGATLAERRALARDVLHSLPAEAKKKAKQAPNPDDIFAPDGDPLDPPPPLATSSLSDNIKAAIKELRAGHISRALGKLFSSGVLKLDPGVQASISSKYPKEPGHMDIEPDPDEDTAGLPEVNGVSFTIAEMLALINAKSPLTGAGADGWCYRHLKDLLKLITSDSTLGGGEDKVHRGLHLFLLDIANGRLDTPTLRPLLTTLRGVALRKRAGSNDVRPIGIGQLFTNIAGTLAVRSLSDQAVRDGVGPTDWMHRTSGGVEALTHFTRAYLHLNPAHVVAKTDVANAFGSISRAAVLEAAKQYPSLVPLATMLYGSSTNVIFTDGDTVLRLLAEMGVTQGEPLAALLYSTALKQAIDATLAAHPTITVRGIADDRLFFGTVDDVIAALQTYEAQLAKSGQHLQRAKTTVYSPQGEATIVAACGALGYATAPGICVGGAPVGDAAFVQQWLKSFVDNVEAKCAKLEQLFSVQELKGVRTQDFYRILR